MSIHFQNTRIELILGDITDQDTDAIVNAANSRLAGGGGVDGAIHRGGGPAIMAQTRELYPDGCPTGGAVITDGGNLKARYVIHAVAPIWRAKKPRVPALLARESLYRAVEHGCQSVAFPSLGTGAYHYPVAEAARIALGAARDFLTEKPGTIPLIRFVLFDEETLRAFLDAAREVFPPEDV